MSSNRLETRWHKPTRQMRQPSTPWPRARSHWHVASKLDAFVAEQNRIQALKTELVVAHKTPGLRAPRRSKAGGRERQGLSR